MDPKALVSSWLDGRARLDQGGALEIRARAVSEEGLAAKFRRAYDWIASSVLHCPYEDLEYGRAIQIGPSAPRIALHGESSYASFLLLPLLTLMTSRRLLIVGAPGRGKTTMATLMALLSGESLTGARRAIQHGHPQLTVSDLLGSPLPSDLVRAEHAGDIKVSWRHWLGKRVKVIDEYNRIPTKTQSALLSLMAEGYAEMYEQVYTCGPSAWFLTANDDLGGGTFPVIEALKDRIDVVVRCTPFNARFIDSLVQRIEGARQPEAFVPSDLVFTDEDLAQTDAEVRAVPVPADVQDAMGFFAGQLDFCRRASDRLEYMNKDTLHLAGRKVAHVCNEDCPLDKAENLCTQTESGISARAYQSLIHYAKAMAWFRGADQVEIEDLRQLAPWVLHSKLQPNLHSPFFQKSEHHVLLADRVSWIAQLIDRAITQHAAYARVREPVQAITARFDEGGEALTSAELRQRMSEIRQTMEGLMRQNELNGPVYEDLVMLKNFYYSTQHALQRRRTG